MEKIANILSSKCGNGFATDLVNNKRIPNVLPGNTFTVYSKIYM